MPDQSNRERLQGLVSEALQEIADLVRRELALLRAELTESTRQVVFGLAMVTGAAVFAIGAVSVLIRAGVAWLATVLHSEALAALIGAGVTAAIAVGLVLYGWKKVSSARLAPAHTVHSFQADKQVILSKTASK